MTPWPSAGLAFGRRTGFLVLNVGAALKLPT
jgi:hypothetical protein